MFLSPKSDIINAEECRRSDKVDHYEVFHDILVNLFQEIMDIEGKALITSEFKDISVNDMHIMEAIGEESANEHHKKFHDGMIQALLKDLDDEQQEILVKSLLNLREFFGSYENQK